MILTLDFETTGLVPKYDAITQIGAVVWDGDKIVDRFRQKVAIPKSQKTSIEALELQCSGDPAEALAYLLDGVELKEAVEAFSAWRDNFKIEAVMAYNVMFDGGFYNEKMGAFGVFKSNPLTDTWIDVCAIARRKLTLRSYRLDAVAAELNLSRTSEIHNALEDAELCGRVYWKLMERNDA